MNEDKKMLIDIAFRFTNPQYQFLMLDLTDEDMVEDRLGGYVKVNGIYRNITPEDKQGKGGVNISKLPRFSHRDRQEYALKSAISLMNKADVMLAVNEAKKN